MKNLTIISTLILFISFPVFAKRLAPAVIEPIQTKRGSIHSSFERNAQGFSFYILMKDKAGDLKWKSKIFSKKYIKGMETDVQDIHLKKMTLENSNIIAIDEQGRRYELDSSDGILIKPVQPHQY